MRVIVDCDPGNGVPGANIDDGLALGLAVAAPELSLELVTTVAGNTPVGLGTAIATDLLSRWGRSTVPVIDVTTQTLLTPADLDRLALIDNELTQPLVDTARPWLAFSAATRQIAGCWLHDPLAVAILVDPGLVTLRQVVIAVRVSPAEPPGSTLFLGGPETGSGTVRLVSTVDNQRLLDLITARFAVPDSGRSRTR